MAPFPPHDTHSYPVTLTDIRNSIVQILTQKDTFSADDFAQVEVSKDLEPQRDALIRTALKDLVEAGMLRELVSAPAGGGSGSIWILTAPLGVAGQEVPISLPTAIHIAREINEFIEAFEEDWPRADCLNIGEHNVLMLLAIIGQLRSTDAGEDDDA